MLFEIEGKNIELQTVPFEVACQTVLELQNAFQWGDKYTLQFLSELLTMPEGMAVGEQSGNFVFKKISNRNEFLRMGHIHQN